MNIAHVALASKYSMRTIAQLLAGVLLWVLCSPAMAGITVTSFETIAEANGYAPTSQNLYFAQQTLTNISPAHAEVSGDWTGPNSTGTTPTWHFVGSAQASTATTFDTNSLTVTADGSFAYEITTTPDFRDPSSSTIYPPGAAADYNGFFNTDVPATYAMTAELGQWGVVRLNTLSGIEIFDYVNFDPDPVLVNFSGSIKPSAYRVLITAGLSTQLPNGVNHFAASGRFENAVFMVQVPEPNIFGIAPAMILKTMCRRKRMRLRGCLTRIANLPVRWGWGTSTGEEYIMKRFRRGARNSLAGGVSMRSSFKALLSLLLLGIVASPAMAGITVTSYETLAEANGYAPLSLAQYYAEQRLTNVSPANAQDRLSVSANDPNVLVVTLHNGDGDDFSQTFGPGELPTAMLSLGAGGDTVTIDLSNGNPLALTALTVHGIDGAGDAVRVVGTAGADIIDAQISLVTINGRQLSHDPNVAVYVDGAGGNDIVNVSTTRFARRAFTSTARRRSPRSTWVFWAASSWTRPETWCSGRRR